MQLIFEFIWNQSRSRFLATIGERLDVPRVYEDDGVRVRHHLEVVLESGRARVREIRVTA